MMDKDGNGILTYDELYESLLSMPGLQSIPRCVFLHRFIQLGVGLGWLVVSLAGLSHKNTKYACLI